VTGIHLGTGKHVAVITSDKPRYVQLLKFRLVRMTTVSVGTVLIKVSVCLFLSRLVTRRAQSWFPWDVICFLVPFVLASLGTLICHNTSADQLGGGKSLTYEIQIFQCNPIAAAWDIDL
jgi:hypothetical protein